MKDRNVYGNINSIQTLGTLDGPGMRYVIFMQGCPLHCGCCHNPEAIDLNGGTLYSAGELVDKILNYKEYFGSDGGITVSGGEPLLQPEFLKSLFRLCRKNGIKTCLDTSGCILNKKVMQLLKYTDHVLLDIKYTDNEKYLKYVGCNISAPIQFLDYIEEMKITTWIRQVIIPTLNDSENDIKQLAEISKKYSCVSKIELLPFKKICKSKYDRLNRAFPFESYPEPTPEQMRSLENLI